MFVLLKSSLPGEFFDLKFFPFFSVRTNRKKNVNNCHKKHYKNQKHGYWMQKYFTTYNPRFHKPIFFLRCVAEDTKSKEPITSPP